jgi:hypothetical protein
MEWTKEGKLAFLGILAFWTCLSVFFSLLKIIAHLINMVRNGFFQVGVEDILQIPSGLPSSHLPTD